MTDLNKLGKTTETIGRVVFKLLVFVISLLAIIMQLQKIGNYSPTGIIGVIVGTLIAIAVFYFVLNLLFRPIYNLNKNIGLRLINQLTPRQFKSKWLISLVCTLIFSLLFIIPTFGISILIMIPQLILLSKSKGI